MMGVFALQYYETNKKAIKSISLTVLITAILSYYLFAIYGYGCPDSLGEGVHYFYNATWQSMCARWAIRYLLICFGNNVVMPLIILLIYSACVIFSVLVLKEKWGIKRRYSLVFISGSMMATPAVISHLMYPYSAIVFAFGFLFSVLFYYLLSIKRVWTNLLAVVCLAIAMGLYQVNIGVVAMLIMLGVILDLLRGSHIIQVIGDIVRYLIGGVIGCVLDVIIYKLECYFRGIQMSNRVTDFSITGIFTSIHQSIPNSYRVFFSYFEMPGMGRKWLYLIFFVCVIALMVVGCVKLAKQKRWKEIVLTCVMIVLLPIGANAIHILIPYNQIALTMQYHYVLVIPFGFALLEMVSNQWLTRLMGICMVGITSTYVIAANATCQALKVSYDVIGSQTQLILSDIFDLEGYKYNETRIMFAGFPGEDIVRQNLEIYDFAIGLPSNVVYWEDMNGIITCRRQYLMNYFGMEAGFFSEEEYNEIVNGEEFSKMPVWPASGSVAMINDFAVVRLSDNPPGMLSK